ncbi:MAG TPA: sigma-70 family RNA polymerase sigma factor [Kineosporiaceae bacterium]|nr:sigma-70 family RNA polymerase sigma factor [Kineosporiaceae bacterium]
MTLPPFQRLVDEHWHAVGRLAHALAGPVDGDDVAQQAWTQALAGYPSLRSAANLRGWLLTITARCAADAHRSRGRRAVPLAELPDRGRPPGTPASGPAGSPDPADLPVGEDLWAAVRALPERQRTAVALRYVADLDHAEIAQLLGTTPAATRRLVSDALAVLRRAVPPPATGPGTPSTDPAPGRSPGDPVPATPRGRS